MSLSPSQRVVWRITANDELDHALKTKLFDKPDQFSGTCVNALGERLPMRFA
jgi:hypothetical protein